MGSNLDFADATGQRGVDPNHPSRSGASVIDAARGIVGRKREKLAIVGYASSSRDMAPFDDDTFEIIGLNQLYRFIPRADFWADLHFNWEEHNVEGTDHRGWIRDCGIPVLMTQRDESLPTSVRYPIEAVIEEGCDYITSTIALLLAWGIHQGYKRIDLYGIDLVVGTEYEHQKACAEFWIGVAHGRGIHVNIPPQSSLLKHTHRYGYELEPNVGLLPLSDVLARISSLTNQRDGLVAKMQMLDGGIYEVGQHEHWCKDPDDRVRTLRDMRHETMVALATTDGALQEAQFVHGLIQMRSRGVAVKMPK